MRAKTCPNPGYLIFSLVAISFVSLITTYFSSLSPLSHNFYLALSSAGLFLCLLTFLSDASTASSKDQLPLLKFKTPYKLCETCKQSMQESTQHCTQCGVCINGFQNHCILLSTCIGQNNKNLFYLLLVILQVWDIISIYINIDNFLRKSYWNLYPLVFLVPLEGYLLLVAIFKICISR